MSDETNEEDRLEELKQTREQLREATKFMYDLQALRISAGNRAGSKTAVLGPDHLKSLHVQEFLLDSLESNAKKELNRLLKSGPFYGHWLKDQKGIGPVLAGVLLSEIDIVRADTPSKIWAYCGIGVFPDGTGQRRRKGEKANFNPWLKAKVVEVMADCFLKSKSPWADFYYNRKTRKENQLEQVCRGCEGRGKRKSASDDGEAGAVCSNCEGTGGPAPWGTGKAHRNRDAKRIMAKMFLREMWREWRTFEGLEVVAPYEEAYLGRTHGDHAGAGAIH